MTCIAFKDGILASDSAATMGGSLFGACRKIARNSKGDLAGVSGDAVYMHAFLEWFEKGEKKKRPNAVDRENAGSSSRGLIIRRNGVIEVYEFDMIYTVKTPYIAIGSGRCEALGAMFAGADAVKAVRAAIAHDAHCGGEIVTLTHSGKKPDKLKQLLRSPDGVPFQ